MSVIQRSSSYPSYLIKECLDLSTTIFENFGASIYASREQVAKVLNKAEPTIQTWVASAVQYGLLEMKSKEGYKVTQLFRQIHRPLPNTNEERDGLLTVLKTPKLYNAVLQSMSAGESIRLAGLSTILTRNHNIAGKVADKAAEIFIENAKYVGVIDADGVYKPDGTTSILEEYTGHVHHNQNGANGNNTTREVQTFTVPAYTVPAMPTATNNTTFNVPLKGKKMAQIILPEDIKSEDFDTVLNWVRLMKESFE